MTKVIDLEIKQLFGSSRSVHFNNMSPEKQRIFPGGKNRDAIIEERSERCNMRRTQPAIDGFKIEEGHQSQGI